MKIERTLALVVLQGKSLCGCSGARPPHSFQRLGTCRLRTESTANGAGRGMDETRPVATPGVHPSGLTGQGAVCGRYRLLRVRFLPGHATFDSQTS